MRLQSTLATWLMVSLSLSLVGPLAMGSSDEPVVVSPVAMTFSPEVSAGFAQIIVELARERSDLVELKDAAVDDLVESANCKIALIAPERGVSTDVATIGNRISCALKLDDQRSATAVLRLDQTPVGFGGNNLVRGVEIGDDHLNDHFFAAVSRLEKKGMLPDTVDLDAFAFSDPNQTKMVAFDLLNVQGVSEFSCSIFHSQGDGYTSKFCYFWGKH